MGVEVVGILLIEAVDICLWVMDPMCSQKLARFPIKFQEFTFIPLDDSKGASHHWDGICAYCRHNVVY
eukprot:9913121-Ditylum_brightwellii.AAC.1